MIKRLRSWFFEDTSTSTSRGKRFRDSDKPDQKAFEELFNSIPFKAHPEDRAKVNDGSNYDSLVGLVVLASNEDVKNKTTQNEDFTLVVGPDQLPESISEDQATFSCDGESFSDTPLEVEENLDGDKIVYKVSLKGTFKTFFSAVLQKLEGLINDFNSLVQTVGNITTQVNSNTEAIGTLSSGTINNVVPIGAVFAYPAFSISNPGYLKCNGQTVLQADYAILYSIIGHNYSDLDSIDPGTEFQLPNWNTPLAGDTIGKTLHGVNSASEMFKEAGRDNVQLSASNLPYHTHPIDFNSGSEGEHNHTYKGLSGGNKLNGRDGNIGKDDYMYWGDPNVDVSLGTTYRTNNSGSHQHNIKGNTGGVNGIGSGSAAFDIMNPYATCVWIIKAL